MGNGGQVQAPGRFGGLLAGAASRRRLRGGLDFVATPHKQASGVSALLRTNEDWGMMDLSGLVDHRHAVVEKKSGP